MARQHLLVILTLSAWWSGALLAFEDSEAQPCPERSLTDSRERLCLKACTQDSDCPNRRKCLCDGECGLSCVAPGRTCLWPLSIPHATSSLLSKFPSFSARAEVRCNPGFKTAEGGAQLIMRCQGDRKWSGLEPYCLAEATIPSVSCPNPGRLEHGYISGSLLTVGAVIQYSCNPGYQLEGTSENVCLENATWEREPPQCLQVYCPPPLEISEGYLVAVQKRQYEAGEVIYYLCKKGFLLDGSNRVTCQLNGNWSKTPFCRARCPIPAHRSRVLYGGEKVWIVDIPEGLVSHGEMVSFFCRKKPEDCSYPIQSECFDGNLALPSCYEEPTWLQYKLFPKRVVSEIPAC
ncbi:beta-2-glycoprotein 1-like [Polypterus senegalus]|uniref:beta-2-glycoprotein 1-like n=1 Tax=Polypterus senegalus TaxID=55291 RepID=UPI001964B447|nr:beta-2-glycoprotein 1-like [Polypterus senegalus]